MEFDGGRVCGGGEAWGLIVRRSQNTWLLTTLFVFCAPQVRTAHFLQLSRGSPHQKVCGLCGGIIVGFLGWVGGLGAVGSLVCRRVLFPSSLSSRLRYAHALYPLQWFCWCLCTPIRTLTGVLWGCLRAMCDGNTSTCSLVARGVG